LILTDTTPTKEQLKTVHATIKKVREDIERFAMNTCVSAFMGTSSKVKLNIRLASMERSARWQPLV